ncbi:MAG: hypothetical protein RL095_2909 [Verrucomicrobiota bacterium]|jgi:uncharacterized membrane protein YheB (UPF0754 family)
MNWDFLIMPAVGAAIGAFTNELALRMLFRPYRPLLIFGFRLPFTPGVIPARRGDIARNIASSFEGRLLSGEEICRALNSPGLRASLEARLRQALATGDLLDGACRDEMKAGLRKRLAAAAPGLLERAAADLAPQMAAKLIDRALADFGPMAAMFAAPLKVKAAPLVGDAMKQLGSELELRIGSGAGDEFLDRLLGELPTLLEPVIPRAAAMLQEGLAEAAAQALGPAGFDIRRRIEERINAMEISELEEMVLGFSREQFRMITILGGVLGGLIGLLQALLVSLR